MGDWGGAPPGWVPPEERAERAAAEQAAAEMNARRAADDARTAAILETIEAGFATLSAAILTAAGVPDARIRGFFSGPELGAPTGPSTYPEPPMSDPDMDDLLDGDTAEGFDENRP